MRLLRLSEYRPYEKMNMIKTGAGVRRLAYLIQAKNMDYTHVQIGFNGKIKTLESAVKSTSHGKMGKTLAISY